MANPLRRSWIKVFYRVSQEGITWFYRVVSQSTRFLVVWILSFLHHWISIYRMKNWSATEVHIIAARQDIGQPFYYHLCWGVLSSLTRGCGLVSPFCVSIDALSHSLNSTISTLLNFYLQCEKLERYRGAHRCIEARYLPTFLEEVVLRCVLKSFVRILPNSVASRIDQYSCS